MRKVDDFSINEKITVDELVKQMQASGGFTSKKLAEGTDIIEEMLNDDNSLNFLSFPADIVSTGTRGVIKDMIKKDWFDVVITTCGTLDHDIARAYKDYYHGSFDLDDSELRKKGMHRLGNIVFPEGNYGIIIEEKMKEFLQSIFDSGMKELSTYELCWEIGKRINNEDSILYWCYKNKVPMVIPGITDGAVGYQVWQFSQRHDFKINVLKDEKMLSDLVWSAAKSGALIIGGGISKHHVIWHQQFRGGLDYAVYITTAVEYDGSLSGARTREAISWGKVNENARHITVESDATIALPIIYAALLDRKPSA
ncbi:MAG: deoxyhypusine synthase [Candidatus Aenigmarchaeota archaeon]|nr:deoxyhypusine synthase [Candidatus Aenigmarchaeota archaeon]